MRARTDDLPDSDKLLLDNVEEYGVHVVHVPAEAGSAGFSFTVGLWHSFEQPEVILFGLPGEVAHDLLNALADEADEGKRFLANSRHEGLLQNYQVRFLEVPKAAYAEYMGAASWAYEGHDFSAVQLVWPDKQGRWPWDAAARQAFRDSQPVLGTREPPA
ncbi:MAG: DUF4262 domain-containing protein [Planctomycetota bacterium]